MARKILSTKKYQKYKSVEFADRLIDTGIMMHFKNGQMYGYFWEIISIIKRDMFCKIKDRHCIRSQRKGERLPTVRRRPWSVWGWERGKSKVFRCLTDGGVSQPNVKIGWKLQRKVEGKIYALAYEQLKWYGKLCNLDSIAVSLSTNSLSIRRQDPNIYSDTETRALST